MKSLEIYGKIIRKYEGDGLIALDTGQICKCLVYAVQLADGKIMASCHFFEDINSVLSCLNKENSVTSVKGVTKNGEQFVLEGQLLRTDFIINSTSDGISLDIVFIAGSLKFTESRGQSVNLVRFGITNFEFSGNKLREYPNGGGAWDILSLNIGDNIVEVHEAQDHKMIMERIKAQRGIDVTSEAVITVSSLDDLVKVTSLIDTLCKLLSLARGTNINWIYYDCNDYMGKTVLSFHRNSIVWQYVGLPLIDPKDLNDTASFINQSFSTYLLHKDDLDRAIETYLDAKRETGFLDIRALKAVVVFEFLKSRYATKKKIEYILKRSQFKKIRHSVEPVLVEQSEAMSLAEPTLNEMESKIGELNRTSFRTILEAMFVELDIGITKDELDRLTKIRNSLVHRASFVTKDYLSEYIFLIGMLDRIFLKLLNYNGIFLDITNKFNRTNTINNLRF